MEVGAVKQAFNNELILLKKSLNQARTQIIHKLTRKAKTLTEKKAPEKLKEKLKRKAESAVQEVLILNKIKVKDLAQFMITHQGDVNDYLNRPAVDQNKACARLILHKALQDKYKHIRGKFANVPIRDLFMSRQERLKLKKEAKEKQKNKKKAKKVVNSEGDWDVEDVKTGGEKGSDDDVSSQGSDGEDDEIPDERKDIEMDEYSDDEGKGADDEVRQSDENSLDGRSDNNESDDDMEPPELRIVENKKDKLKENIISTELKEVKAKPVLVSKKQEKKRDVNKNKNFNEKIKQGKFKKSEDDVPITQNKIVDPFFITSTGENYLSLAEPRQPDEVKEIHKQGNRKLRRAVMFGHVPKIKPRTNNYDESRFRQNTDRGNFKSKFSDRTDKNANFNGNGKYNNDRQVDKSRNFHSKSDDKPEKLHPSWEAKKKQSGILPFQGKKIVFDES